MHKIDNKGRLYTNSNIQYFNLFLSNHRSSEKQLLHRFGRLSAPGVGQWHGSVSLYRASPAVGYSQPDYKQKKRHFTNRQRTQPGGMETA